MPWEAESPLRGELFSGISWWPLKKEKSALSKLLMKQSHPSPVLGKRALRQACF